MKSPTRRMALATLAAGAVGGVGGSLASNESRPPVPVMYADDRSELPSPQGPALGLTPSGLYLRTADSTLGWEGPISAEAPEAPEPNTPDPDLDSGPSPDVERSSTADPPDITSGGVEVVNPDDDPSAAADELHAILAEYAQDPLYLVVAEGEIRLDRNLRIPSNTWLRGFGMTTVFSLADGTQLDLAGMIRIVDGAVNVRLSDFVIDGNRQNVADHGKEYGFFSKNAYNVCCRGLWIRNCPGYGFDPHADEEWETTSNLRIHECVAENNGLDGITLAGIEHGIVSTCISRYNNRHGIQITDPDNRTNSLVGNVAVGNGGSGIVVQNGASEAVVSSNLVRGNSRDGIKISNTDDWSSHCTVTGNSATANGRYGIAVLKAVDVAVVANSIRENANGDHGNAEISLQSGSNWGARGCVVVGNVTSSTDADYGIDEQSEDVGPNVIVANICDDAIHTNINRRNPESTVGFNVGTEYRVQGQVHLGADETAARLDTTPHTGTSLNGISVTPISSLGAANEFWVESTDGGYRVRIDEPPGQQIDFAFAIDAR